MAKILITGGTGLIGNELCKKLIENGHEVSVLTRTLFESKTIKSYLWNISKATIDENSVVGVDHIIHLAGCGIADKNWSEARKKEILDTRVNSAHLLLRAIKSKNVKIKSFVGASAIGIYGMNTSETIYKETDIGTIDFLSETCKKWENTYTQFLGVAQHQSIIRIGVVLANNGGALKKLIPIFKLGLGSAVGSGKQYVPWIQIDDLVEVFYKAVFNNNYEGIYNAVASEQVNNHVFSKQLAISLRKPFFVPNVPAFLLKIIFGEMANVLLLGSRVSNDKLISKGFVFKYPLLKDALLNI